jgi:hypothetical protein
LAKGAAAYRHPTTLTRRRHGSARSLDLGIVPNPDDDADRRELQPFRLFVGKRGDRGVIDQIVFVAEPRKIPVVLSPEEVARFLEAVPAPKYKAALSAAYGAGLRSNRRKNCSEAAGRPRGRS